MNSSALFLTAAVASLVAERESAVVLRGDASDRRQPVHLIFNIDISDSMNDGNKLESVKRSMEFIIPLLTPDDLVSIIAFGEQSSILLNKLSAAEKDTILYKVRGLRTDGCTNLSAGLMNINECLADTPPTHKSGVLLLTDGHANRGVSSAEGLQQIVQQLIAANPALTLTTVGYGHDHNIELLRNIATTGAGSYNIVYNLENVATTFGEVLGGMTTVVAQNVVVHFPAGTKLKTGYAVQTDAEDCLLVRVGDVYAENEIIILATLPPSVTTVKVTGHNMLTLAAYESVLTVAEPEAGAGVPKNVEQAMFRYRVSTLLKEAAAPGVNRTTMKERAEALLAELKELPYAAEQLIQMMVDDMETLLERLETPVRDHYLEAAMTSQMAQHSAYLALGRGMRTASTPMPAPAAASAHTPQRRQNAVHFAADSDAEEEPTSPTPAPGLTTSAPPAPAGRQRTAQFDADVSPFMNAAQRRVTSLMRTSSQQPQ
jgi:Mg-chelatase subunit ChlD